MRIIYTKHFPPGNFHGINLFGIVFVQRRWGKFLPHEVTHEMVHTYQQRELLFILFFLLYLLEYLVRLVQYRFNTFEAYRNISFEREAYAHQGDLDYRHHRPFWAWRKCLRSKSNP